MNEELRTKNEELSISTGVVQRRDGAKRKNSSFFIFNSSFLTRVSVVLWRGARGLIGLKINIKF